MAISRSAATWAVSGAVGVASFAAGVMASQNSTSAAAGWTCTLRR